MRGEDALIEALRQRFRASSNYLPPLTDRQIAEAETRLGFSLPSFLRRLYSEAGNGDTPRLFPLTAPDEGLGTTETESVVAWYRGLRDNPPSEDDFDPEDQDDPLLEWPERLLMIRDWGCNICSCVDCAKPELPVFRNSHGVCWNTFALEARTLHEWLDRYLDDERLFWLDWERAPRVRFPN